MIRNKYEQNSMNKAELITAISAKMSVPQVEARRFVNAFEEALAEELEQEGTLLLQGFGTFVPWQQAARMGRNPRTGEICPIRQRVSVKFKPGKLLLDRLNSTE